MESMNECRDENGIITNIHSNTLCLSHQNKTSLREENMERNCKYRVTVGGSFQV